MCSKRVLGVIAFERAMDTREAIRVAMEWAALALDTIAVVVIVSGVVVSALRTGPIRALLMAGRTEPRFKQQRLGSLLLGLDLLVASDVVQTVAVETTLANISALGVLVLIRIALTWSLLVESEGRWPWQSPSKPRLPDAEHETAIRC